MSGFHGASAVARELAHALRDRADAVEAQVRLDAVERAERERDLAEIGVPGALAHPVDRPLHPGRARADRGDGRRRGDAEVVVAVEVDRHAGPDPADGTADELGDRLGRGDPERVHDDDLLGAGLDRAAVDLLVEAGIGAGRVDAEERGVDPVLGGEAHRVGDPPEHLLAADADRVELEVGDRRLDHRGAHAELDERLEVGGDRAREAPDLGAQAGGGDQLDRAPVVVRDAGEARFDPVDPELVERARDLELLLRVEHDADRLLAVAERRVVQADRAAEAERVVELAGPDQVAHRKSSGKRQSFSGPAAVIR